MIMAEEAKSTTEVVKEPRTIDQLIDLPYSEMTEEEIGIVVDWKAARKAEEGAQKKIVEDNIKAHEQMIAEAKATADAAREEFISTYDSALDRLNRASRGELI